MKSSIRNGNQVEDLVEIICNRMFFSDFVVRNPKYDKNGGPEKEAADLLVPFEDYLLAFQVKSKQEFSHPKERSEIEYKRIANVANEAVAQLKTIRRVIDNEWLGKLETVKGFEIPFSAEDYEHVIGIVVIDLVGEENFPRNERTNFYTDYLYEFDMPIHIFMRDDFDLLSTELDTLPDFVQFLDVKKQLIENSLLRKPIHVLDFLAFYKTSPEIIEKALTNNTHLYLEEGIWDSYQDKFSDTIKQRNQLNRPSYLIDQTIDFLHKSVGYSAFEQVEKELGVDKLGGIRGYLTSARELAKLSRLERRVLGGRLLRCMKIAESKKHSYSMIKKNEKAYLVLSMNGDRADRQMKLYQLCSIAYCYLEVKQIVGVATESLKVSNRSFEVFGLHEADFENSDELAKQGENIFSKPYRPNITEYQGRIDDT